MTPDPRGQTLWEMFLAWLSKPSVAVSGAAPRIKPAFAAVSDQPPPLPRQNRPPLPRDIPNPLNLAPQDELWPGGHRLNVNEGAPARVVGVRLLVRTVDQQSFDCVDYLISSETPEGNPCDIRLRVIPNETNSSPALVLELYDHFPVDDGFLDVVQDPSGYFDIDEEDGSPVQRFHRLHDLRDAWAASACSWIDANENGRYDEGQSPFSTLDYWDFERPTPNGPEFLFIEYHHHERHIEMWRGFALHISRSDV